MLEMVKARREGDKVEERYDLFSGLLDAAQDEQGGEVVLNDDELMGGCSMSRSFEIHVLPVLPGNMFIFLIAGHEVRFSCSSCGVVPKQFSADHSAYTMLHICFVGSSS
jgi:hypothetical protein